MLNKISLFLATFLGVLAVILFFWTQIQAGRITSLESQKNTLKANNNVLINRLEREHNDKVALGEKIEQLEQLAKTDTNFDWNTRIADTSVVRWLRENAIRVQGSRARAD